MIWFKKKPSDREQEAVELGQRLANEMVASLEEYTSNRFGAVKQNFLDVLRDRLRNSLRRQDVPPLTAARIEYQLFLGEVNELPSKMTSELRSVMEEWIELADEMGLRDEVDRLISHSVEQITGDLTELGLQVLTDYAVLLDDADTLWRKENPDKAGEFPLSDN